MEPPLYDTARNSRFFPRPEFYPTVNLPADCGWNVDFGGPFCNYLQIIHGESKYILGVGRAGNLVGFTMPPQRDQPADVCILRVPHTDTDATFKRAEFPEDRLTNYLNHSAEVAQQRAINSASGSYFCFQG